MGLLHAKNPLGRSIQRSHQLIIAKRLVSLIATKPQPIFQALLNARRKARDLMKPGMRLRVVVFGFKEATHRVDAPNVQPEALGIPRGIGGGHNSFSAVTRTRVTTPHP